VIGEALLVEEAKSQEHLSITQEDKQMHASKNVSLFFTVKNLGSLLTVPNFMKGVYRGPHGAALSPEAK